MNVQEFLTKKFKRLSSLIDDFGMDLCVLYQINDDFFIKLWCDKKRYKSEFFDVEDCDYFTWFNVTPENLTRFKKKEITLREIQLAGTIFFMQIESYGKVEIDIMKEVDGIEEGHLAGEESYRF